MEVSSRAIASVRNMTRGNRTETPERAPALVTSLAVAGLSLTAAVHVVWARGSTWPAANAAEFVDLIMGTPVVAVSALDLVSTTDKFRRWNLRAYSPLCLGFAAAGFHAARQRCGLRVGEQGGFLYAQNPPHSPLAALRATRR